MDEPKKTFEEFFSNKQYLSSSLLNKLGAPVLRNILTNFFFNLKRYKNFKIKNNLELELVKNGIISIPNFLPNNDFEDLKREFKLLISKKNNEDRFNGIKSIKIENHEFDQYPAMKKLRNNDKLKNLICAGEGLRQLKINKFAIENTRFGNKQQQKQYRGSFYHADVHFHSHKVLFYMNDVKMDCGPFVYCKNSHKNKLGRLIFEFMRGQLSDSHKEGWRIQKHLDKFFFKTYFQKLLKEEIKVACPANTLVIANVHGFHKRGESIPGVERSLIRIPFRYNPLGPTGHLSHDLYSGTFF